MKISFSKYHGTGNDFILIDDRNASFNIENTGLIAKMCDRHFGIGADGLMLLRKKEDFDFEMIYFNSDGNQSSMCGNGGRCIVQFAHDLGIIKNSAHFIAIDGSHSANIANSLVQLEMLDVAHIDCLANGHFQIETGSPHYISQKANVFQNNQFLEECKAIRNSDKYQKLGINVNQIEIMDNHQINARTYERGVENETLSCGTGAVACAIASHKINELKDGEYTIEVNKPGGKLVVHFLAKSNTYKDITLTGTAQFVFKGTY